MAFLVVLIGDHSTAAPAIETVAGQTDVDDGPATDALFRVPTGVAVDATGNLYIADLGNNRVRRLDAVTGIVATVAGTGEGSFGGDGGPAVDAHLFTPRRVALDANGNLYVAEVQNSRVRRVEAATGVISTVAGTGATGFSGDGGPAVDASLDRPAGLGLDASGNLYIADTGNQRIRRVDAATGVMSTFAGTGEGDFGGDDGPAVDAQLRTPTGVAVDANGNVFIADLYNHRIRRVDADTGVITTVAGTGIEGFGGNGGPAVDALLSMPSDLSVDANGNLYIVDSNNLRIRRVDADTGVISGVAGSGEYGFRGDGGPALDALLGSPSDVAVDATGNLYIADAHNHRIRRVKVATGIIDSVAGRGNGDGGPAADALLISPTDVAVDAIGNLYIA
ncbi:MAG: hypothetical protein OXE40_19510, partial [Gammaproteobacteria bacterium]|nr:hypothetical protein [Gammaproteobacteria bacterium]